jgi:hypothetical protein
MSWSSSSQNSDQSQYLEPQIFRGADIIQQLRIIFENPEKYNKITINNKYNNIPINKYPYPIVESNGIITINENKWENGIALIRNKFQLYNDSEMTILSDNTININNVRVLFPLPRLGGSKNKYIKTSKEYKDKAGKTYKVYSKGENMYIKKKSAKTGKFGYRKVNIKKI